MRSKHSWLVSAAFFLFTAEILGQTFEPVAGAFEVRELSPGRIVFSLLPIKPEFRRLSVSDSSYDAVHVPGFGASTRPGYPMVPQTAALVRIPAGETPTVRVVESGFEEVPQIKLIPAPEAADRLNADETGYSYAENPAIYRADNYFPQTLAHFSGAGQWRGQEIARIQVNPVQYNPARQTLRIYTSLTVEVTFADAGSAQIRPAEVGRDAFARANHRLLLNSAIAFSSHGDDLQAAPDAPTDWYDPQFAYFKMTVDEEGIYTLTLQELLDAGVPVSQPLSNLKILNRGQQIPLWLDGAEDGSLDTEDTIYFYAVRNRPEQGYYDLYTDNNTYWLTFDGGSGLRYDLRQSPAAAPNPPAFYWQTLHIEQENQFHRSNRSSITEPDEGWIWRYFFADDEELVDFNISGLYQAVASCSLRARFHGTTIDPVAPDHHLQIWLNETLIADAFFDDRQELLLQTDFATALMQSGNNQLRIRLLSDTGAQVNQVYLDWIELTFPRAYAADNDRLRFSPATSSGESIHFALRNFRDAEVTVLDPAAAVCWRPATVRQSFYTVESAGFDDGKFSIFTIDDTSYTFKNRGHNLAVIDLQSGVPEFRNFDTFGSGQQANDMADFINGLPADALVLVSISDDGTFSMTESAYQALESLGSALTRQVQGRDSWALIGRKGAAIGTAKEALSRRFAGPAAVRDTLTGDGAFRYTANFSDAAGSAQIYVAASAGGTRKVNAITKESNSDLLNPAQGADYIIISHRNFLAPAQALADYRSQHNDYRTLVVDVEDIYDQFNYGILHPGAIRNFLHYTFRNWQKPAPTFVVLFGDGSWDPKRYMDDSRKTDFIPVYGSLVSDNWYVAFDGPDDFLPEMYIGRIPVETAEQGETVINKIIKYEASPFDAWNKEFLFLNGGANDVEQSIFVSQATTLASDHITPPPFGAAVTHLNKTTDVESIDQSFIFQAADIIRKGAVWVNFIGHAGSAIWDINIEGPEVWRNAEVFPFMTGMSCHSARFANPINNSLSEKYFLSSMGASAYWGSSGFGYITQDFFLLDGLFHAVSKDTVRSVGAATTQAKLHLWQVLGDQPRNRYVIEQYTLIGDPAMRLAISTEPELVIRAQDVNLDRDYLLTSDSTAALHARPQNFGLVPADSVEVAVGSIASDGSRTPLLAAKIPAYARADSLDLPWPVPDTPGPYRLQVALDPNDEIEEIDESNNVAELNIEVFESDISLLKPVAFGVVTSPSVNLVSNNSRSLNQQLTYFFEIDTSAQFGSPLLARSAEITPGRLVTSWAVDVRDEGVYHWRARTFDGDVFGPWAEHSFFFDPAAASTWRQSDGSQFTGNKMQQIESDSTGAVILKTSETLFEAESGGFIEGSRAFILRNGELVSLNLRGHNLAVFDETDGTLLSRASFDTFIEEANSDSLAEYLRSWDDGRVIIAAIRDEGSANMTEAAYQALESIGSQFTRQVGFRDSWAIIGRKGAPAGSVVEGWKVSGDGPVVIADTLTRFAKTGSMLSPPIGPALAWRSAHFNYEISSETESIAFDVLGRNQVTGQMDTLMRAMSNTNQLDLSTIAPKLYPTLQLQAVLSSDNGLTTPALNAWAVDYAPPPDLVAGRESITLTQDTVQVGDPLDMRILTGNFGLTASDSFTVRVFAGSQGEPETSLSTMRVAGLPVDETADYTTQLATETLQGKVRLRLHVDADDDIPELNENNNKATATVWVVRDTVSPDIRVTFDGHAVAMNEFVSTNPTVAVEIYDQSAPAISDTSRISVFVDERKVSYGPATGQAQLLPQNDADNQSLKAIALFQPQLSVGTHQIEVIAKDASDNLQYFQTEFIVSERFLLANVMNYPNPFRNNTHFTYTLTQAADQVRIKVYTVSGRLILEIEPAPGEVGYNQVLWDGRDQAGDALANGVYLYKVIAKRGNEQKEVVEKFVVMR